MKKVLLLAPMSSVHERFNKVNIAALQKLGCEIHMAANFECGTEEAVRHNLAYKKNLAAQGIVAHQLPFQRSSLVKNLPLIKQCRALFQAEKFAMIHAHTETGGLITRMAMPGSSNTKYAFTPHGMSFYKGSSLKSWLLYYPVEKWICRRMHAVLAMNQEELAVLKGWDRQNTAYIHGMGLDDGAFSEVFVDRAAKRAALGIPKNALLVLSIGELNENKNHETIIRALKRLDNESIYYLVCGEGHLKSYLEDLCTDFGLAERVVLAGYRRDIAEIVQIADVFAFPSFHEGLSVALMEAMAAGLPVICSKIRGNVDLIGEGEGGFLCRPADVQGFAERLGDLLENAEQRKQMAAANRRNIKKFTKEVVFSETVKIYAELLG